VTSFGEARAWTTHQLYELQKSVGKSQLFDELPAELSSFNKWLPGFKLTSSVVPYSDVYVVFRPKSTAAANVISEWKEHPKKLPKVWFMVVLIPALRCLPPNTRTRRFNGLQTIQQTDLLPSYVRLYNEDIVSIDQALLAPVGEMDDFNWFFMCHGFGQRKLLEEDDSLSPEAFGLGIMFDLTNIVKISLHIAINITCADASYSLFWHRERTHNWIQGESFICLHARNGNYTIFASTYKAPSRRKRMYPLFGLSELGNVTAVMPTQPALQAALGEECVTYAQFYTPTVKGMEERVPLAGHPNLLTYLLGEAYVSTHAKFKRVWDEVRTHRTYFELLEMVHPSVPLDARMEVVVTAADTSFLSSFGHCRLTRIILRDGLLIKVRLISDRGYIAGARESEGCMALNPRKQEAARGQRGPCISESQKNVYRHTGTADNIYYDKRHAS
jgi:hypothetical protein